MLLAAVSAGCGGREVRPVTIGINPWPGYETLYLAAEKGIFTQHGLRIELKEFSSLGDARRAYERGQIDGMACTMVEVLQARAQSSRQPVVIMALDYSAGADVILARPGIVSVRGLRGRRVAAEIASLGLYVITRAAELNGVSLEDIHLTPADQTEMEPMARSGQVDAAVTYPPVAHQLARLGWKPVFDSRAIPGEVVDVIALDRPVLEAEPGFQKAILGAMRTALEFLRTHREEAIAIMAARERVTTAEFERSLSEIEMIPPSRAAHYLAPGGPIEKLFAKLSKTLHESGQLTSSQRLEGLVAPIADLAPEH